MSYSPFFFEKQGTGSTKAVVSNYFNATGNAIPQGTPLSSTGVGNYVEPTDCTSEASVHAFVGLAQFRIPNNSLGPVISSGRLENLNGYAFSIGDAIYMGLGGIIQNTKPDYNVTGFQAGDVVVFIGVVVQNENDPLNQDLQVLPQIIGEL